MASSSLSEDREVQELLNFYKETTLVIDNSINRKFQGSKDVIDSIISPVIRSGKPKRLVVECTDRQIIVKAKQEPVEEVFLVNEKDRGELWGNATKVQPLSYVEEDILNIVTQVIEVDPLAPDPEEENEDNEEDRPTCISDVGFSEISMQKSDRPTKEMQRELIKPNPDIKEIAVKELKKRKGQAKRSFNQTDKINKPNKLGTRSINRPLKEIRISPEREKISNILPTTRSSRGALKEIRISPESEKISNILPTTRSTRALKEIRISPDREKINNVLPTTRRGTRTLKNKITECEKISNVLPTKKSTHRTRSSKGKTRSGHSTNQKDSKEVYKPYICFGCDKSFRYASALNAHEFSHTGIKPYKCEHCPSSFSQKSHFTRHSITHKKNSKKFKCSDCKKKFHQNYYLQVHMRTHSGDRPFTCNICSKSFAQKSHLNTHAKSHQEKRFSCDICSQCFTLSHHLASHMKHIHKHK